MAFVATGTFFRKFVENRGETFPRNQYKRVS